MNRKSPHAQAAFINAIREEGSKKEACDNLQETWNDLCAARVELATLRAKMAERSQASLDVLAERHRQITAEDWTPEHDDAQALAEAERLQEVAEIIAAAHATLGAIDEINAKHGLSYIGGPPMRLAKALAKIGAT